MLLNAQHMDPDMKYPGIFRCRAQAFSIERATGKIGMIAEPKTKTLLVFLH
jgi:hypothetical protein